MTELTWDAVGTRRYETGVDHGVLYLPNEAGEYDDGVAWNGLVTVTEKPSGADANPQFADNIKYLNLIAAEQFGATIEAFTYPDEFAQFDGLAEPETGVLVGQQRRGSFGLSYRTKIGDDVEGNAKGYKLHLVYGCQVTPSEKAYSSVNDSPEALQFSWDLSSTPVLVTDLDPTSILIIDSTKVDSGALGDLMDFLYGTVGTDPSLPFPDDVIALFTGSITDVTAVNNPTYNGGTHVVTIVATTGVVYTNADTDEVLSAGAQPALSTGQHLSVKATAATGYHIVPGEDTFWNFDY